MPIWSPELETLDQLLGGDLPLSVIRLVFDDDERFVGAVQIMLHELSVRLLNFEGNEVADWQRQEILIAATRDSLIPEYQLSLTMKGAARVS